MTSAPTAPYKRFRPTQFYAALYGGCYTADLMDCNWACEKCWSRYGGKGDTPTFELTPDQVVDKLIGRPANAAGRGGTGMLGARQMMARISYGEPGMHWPHVAEVIAGFLERTRGQRMVIPGFTDRRGEPMGIIIETNGSLLKPRMMDELEDRHGDDAARIVINVGIKATSPELLSELTGHAIKTARRFHQAQLDLILHLAYNCPRIVMWASFLDRFTDPEVLAALGREVERARPGLSRNLDVLDFKNYQGTTRLYTPKRMRAADAPHPDDEESAVAIAAPDGPRRREELAPDDNEPTEDPDGRDPFDRDLRRAGN